MAKMLKTRGVWAMLFSGIWAIISSQPRIRWNMLAIEFSCVLLPHSNKQTWTFGMPELPKSRSNQELLWHLGSYRALGKMFAHMLVLIYIFPYERCYLICFNKQLTSFFLKRLAGHYKIFFVQNCAPLLSCTTTFSWIEAKQPNVFQLSNISHSHAFTWQLGIRHYYKNSQFVRMMRGQKRNHCIELVLYLHH
jgi:hypothetical protein